MSLHTLRPRELRRSVVVPARLRHGTSWTDACILNISSRGLMIHTGRPVSCGNEVEIRRGIHVIVARVVWHDGARAGLQADERVPVEEIMTLGQSPSIQLAAGSAEQRKQTRAESRIRRRRQMIEFAGALVLAASLAGAGLVMVQQPFGRPLALVEGAISP